ncbi:TcfC E-set like domain-containing protein [Escherichia coli]|uniref:TcfC E-set like domain-containing protein n=1 Tax=Escherichia coli TaxID=562 RepID=UPI000BE60A7E|nr:TcfC E-set like domain-containing protein [Escherichia coli]EEQ2597209.1 hypothetical protein [Escherichia coli]EEQ4335273.1 hypothetical protein [Escherichia coli]EEQ9544287.1 hypothetical protein [Escherichia coli]EEQ9574491.1 hypothetical protein [Escherichia coli]EFC4941957.1 hypothetical protein [Escherichia coli]
MFKLAMLSVMISISLSSNSFAEERSITIASINSLAFANGERIASSRYASILNPGSEQVQLTFDGVSEINLDAELSIDTVKFRDNDALAAFLKEVGVKSSAIEKIVEMNKADGFIHSSSCKGRRSECIVRSKYVDFIIDYYDKRVRVFFAPNILIQESGEKSYLNMNGGAGLVNNISAYYDGDNNRSNSSYYLRDQGRSGFNSGYLSYNIYKSNYDAQIDDLYFTHALFSRNKFSIGRMASVSDFNASSSQSLFSGTALTGLRIGTASEYVDRSYGNRNFRYYSPENGSIEVRRNGNLIYAASAVAGYNDLNLDGLPSGSYTAELIILSASGAVVSRQAVIVNNSNGNVNEFSWHLFGGLGSDIYGYVPAEDKKVVEGGFQIPFMNNAALFFGGGAVDTSGVISTGLSYTGEHFVFTSKLGEGSDNLRYYEGSLFLDAVSLTYNKTTYGEHWNKGLPGRRSDTSFTANYNSTLTDSLSLNGGYLYTSSSSPLVLTGIDNDYNFFNDKEIATSRFSTRSLYANIYYASKKGISMYMGVNKELSGSAYNISLGFSIPMFSNNFSLNSTSYYSDGGRVSTSIVGDYTNNISETWSHRVSTGTYIGDEKYSSLGYSLYHNSNYMYGSGYYYQTDNGLKRYTLNGNSTQVLSGAGLDFISSGQLNNAFITVDKNLAYDIAVKDMTTNTTTYLDGKKRIIPVPAYHKLKVTASTEAVDYVLERGKSRDTRTIVMVPGSTTDVSVKAIKVSSVIITMRNESGEYLPGASCDADSCVSADRLGIGVYRIKFTGKTTQVRAGDYKCNVNTLTGKRFYDITCR